MATTTKSNETAILVTGATGTVGSEVVKQLTSPSLSRSSGLRVRAAVHSQNKGDVFKRNNKTVEVANMDYNKPQTIAEALNNVDKLFWLTLPRPNMTEISSSLIREAKKNNVKHIVKLSVMGADAEPGTTIGRLHRHEEKIIEGSGIPYTFLRAGAFMQNFINFFGQTIKNQNAFYLPAGDGKVSFVDVRDIAAVAVELLTKNGIQHEHKAYGITGKEALSYSEVAEILSKVIGKKISYINIPEEDAQKSMKETGMEDWLIAALMELYNIIRSGYASQTIDTVEQILGRKAISFEQFVKDHNNSFN
jgi:uncharacterized protein YbjT (DUF2867 family)